MANIKPDALKDYLRNNNIYNTLGLNDSEIEQYIDNLVSNGTISPENQKKLDLIGEYAQNIVRMLLCKSDNIDAAIYGKTIAEVKNGIASLNNKNQFITDGIENQNDTLNQLLKNMNNCYLDSIYNNLGITDDAKKTNFSSISFNKIAQYAQLIDFIKTAESKISAQQDKNDLKTLLKEIEKGLTADYSGQQSPVDITKEFENIYKNAEQKLDTILSHGNLTDDQGKSIKNFQDGKNIYAFDNSFGQIDDIDDQQLGFNNINHPMRYLLEDLEIRRHADSQNFGDGKLYNVNVSEQDPAGWKTMFDGQSYKMGDSAKVGVFDRNTWNLLSGTLNNTGSKMTISHEKDQNMNPLALQASINATVKSMKVNFGQYSNDPDNYKFNLKLKSKSPATCQVMFEELFKYAEAYQAQQAQQTTSEQDKYNERFKHFKDIYINDVKLNMDIFKDAQKYTQNNKLDKNMFAAEVYDYLEKALTTKQTQNANGNTSVQLTDQEQILQSIIQQRNAGGRP